ncbi:hypothetical protein EsH8_I_000366 [Colletotrichum jinshuiense]
MAPSDKKIQAALLEAVHGVFKSNKDDLTVNFIRKRVESELELEDGFFSSGKWKDKSKKLIKELATDLMEGNATQEADSSPAKDETDAKPKKIGKRQSTEASPPPKRRKRASVTNDEEPEESASENEKPKPGPKPKKKAAARKKKDSPVIDSDDDPSPVEPKPSKAQNRSASKVEDSGSDDLSSPPDSEDEKVETAKEEPQAEKSKVPGNEKKLSVDAKGDDEPAEKQPEVDSEKKTEEPVVPDDTTSELSDVIDEPPKPKRRKKGAASSDKAPKQKKAPAAAESPDDAEVKKLQSHLVKCGIRKIWGFELKQYGDNTKAKIKHLRGMLKDIGMDGRFSEAKAKEIKERRELEADLEAVKEMNANWGAGGRSSRSKARAQSPPSKKIVKDAAAEDDRGEEDEDDDEEEAVISSRARGKARADLAFLGDDDSDSD